VWSKQGWEDYLYWQQADKKMLKRINTLIKEAMREPFEGIGSPEAIKHRFIKDGAGYWSRRLDREHRLVYTVVAGSLVVAQCRYHY
jgi:toxin YoeB